MIGRIFEQDPRVESQNTVKRIYSTKKGHRGIDGKKIMYYYIATASTAGTWRSVKATTPG